MRGYPWRASTNIERQTRAQSISRFCQTLTTESSMLTDCAIPPAKDRRFMAFRIRRSM